MTFRVGQKVARVGSGFAGGGKCIVSKGEFSYPQIGEICTVRQIWDSNGICLITVYEHSNAHLIAKYGFAREPGFAAEFFRPIVENKSEISFTQGAPKDSEKFDNRRKVRERA